MPSSEDSPREPLDLPLAELFGSSDIYLFDQILRRRIRPGMRVLDAGCGAGRNLVYLLRAGYEVFGVDRDSAAVAQVRSLAGSGRTVLQPPGVGHRHGGMLPAARRVPLPAR